MNLQKILDILPNRIRTFRNSKNWTQERLAEEVNVHATYISRIESGKKLPTLFIICKIADVLGINTYELLIDELKIASYDYQRRKLIEIVRESRPADLDIYSILLTGLHKRRKKGKNKKVY